MLRFHRLTRKTFVEHACSLVSFSLSSFFFFFFKKEKGERKRNCFLRVACRGHITANNEQPELLVIISVFYCSPSALSDANHAFWAFRCLSKPSGFFTQQLEDSTRTQTLAL